MHLELDRSLADQYKSPSQKARVLTEGWVRREAYCPDCGNTALEHYSNNKPVADFFCRNCSEDFELKSKRNSFGQKIVDGEYETMISRLVDVKNPNFFLLNYESQAYRVLNFFVIPKHFFVPDIIEARKPLSETAERRRWMGCNILLQGIPVSGRIYLVKNSHVEPKQKVLQDWQKTLFLRDEKNIKSKSWIIDVMNCIERLNKKEFVLDEVYNFEAVLYDKHPGNRHVKDKIRQQLQVLRDKGYLEFVGRGRYKIIT